ncbi:hypothetical protein UFOVP787_13 [uncultured Caudovirales phage]|uniref:Uncharacterized protein n=1 Tax=uncultured Caudovirales phage TaxID=2100421 RepID=A0A6J5NXR8_9CAUD|nr:hypothetical protein UFOVP787_13 [uncultured Caudovirales phage]
MTWGHPDDYYRELSWRSKNPNAKPLSEKEQKDLELLETTKHYEQVLRHKIALQKLQEREENDG